MPDYNVGPRMRLAPRRLGLSAVFNQPLFRRRQVNLTLNIGIENAEGRHVVRLFDGGCCLEEFRGSVYDAYGLLLWVQIPPATAAYERAREAALNSRFFLSEHGWLTMTVDSQLWVDIPASVAMPYRVEDDPEVELEEDKNGMTIGAWSFPLSVASVYYDHFYERNEGGEVLPLTFRRDSEVCIAVSWEEGLHPPGPAEMVALHCVLFGRMEGPR